MNKGAIAIGENRMAGRNNKIVNVTINHDVAILISTINEQEELINEQNKVISRTNRILKRLLKWTKKA